MKVKESLNIMEQTKNKKNKQSEMSKITIKALGGYLLFFLVFFCLLTIVSFTVFQSVSSPEKKIVLQVPISVIAGDYIGLNADTDQLNFGIVPFGSSGIKTILVTNTYSVPILLDLSVTGNISSMAGFISPVRIEPNETSQLRITISVPGNAVSSSFSGEFKGYYSFINT